MFMYLADVVERRRQEPGDDLISRLDAGADPDAPDSLSPIEITLFAVLLLVAGNATTTNLLGTGAAAFAARRDQAGSLRLRPDLLAPAKARQTVVQGRRGSGRVGPGGRRHRKQKNHE